MQEDVRVKLQDVNMGTDMWRGRHATSLRVCQPNTIRASHMLGTRVFREKAIIKMYLHDGRPQALTTTVELEQLPRPPIFFLTEYSLVVLFIGGPARTGGDP